jgi:adenosine kinase
MSITISGSLAFDTLLTFEGQFRDQILADRLDALSVSFLAPGMRREFGGCAGNIAYNLHLLGEKPLVLASLGIDGADYKSRMDALGLDTRWVQQHADLHTAQATILTDRNSNQITAFHPGAMAKAHETRVPDAATTSLAIVAPNGKQAMTEHAAQFAKQGTPFVWDPGQGLPMFSGDELNAIVPLATWVTVNDYEADMLAERMGKSFGQISTLVRGLVITRGEAGCDVWVKDHCERLPAEPAAAVIDPTGCGDSFRAGLLYGLARQWPLATACKLGNRIGAIKIAQRGGQSHRFERDEVLLGF